jgi:curved DNA-binding protein CbpA
MGTFYERLGISPSASIDDIRRAFRQSAKRLHPDLTAGTDALMRQLNEAYETLRDPQRRVAYDEALKPKAYRLPQRPAAGGADGVDPFAFKAQIFLPLDQRLKPYLQLLDLAIRELAYDVFDDAYIARFSAAVADAESALANAHERLFSAPWPSPLASALNLYRQGLRQADDAVEDFQYFSSTLDTDMLVEGQALLRLAVSLLDEARGALVML